MKAKGQSFVCLSNAVSTAMNMIQQDCDKASLPDLVNDLVDTVRLLTGTASEYLFAPVGRNLRLVKRIGTDDPFIVSVKDEYHAFEIMKTLGEFRQHIVTNGTMNDKPFLAKVQMLNGEEWVEYYNECEGLKWSDVQKIIFNHLKA